MKKLMRIEFVLCLGLSLVMDASGYICQAHAESAKHENSVDEAGATGGVDEKNKEEEDKEPQTIDSGAFDSSSAGVDVSTDLTDPPISPIVGSVGYVGDKCVVSVRNNSQKNKYSVSYAVEGYDGGKKSFSRSFSSTLGAGQSDKHDFSCRKGLALRLDLRSGTKKK